MPINMKTTAALSAISLVLLVAGCATSESVPKGEVLRSGLCVQRETSSYAQPQSTAGYATLGDMQITREATVVPLKKNASFGFSWRATGMPQEAVVEFVVKHPKITRPDGKTLEGFIEPLKLYAENGIIQSTDCYALSENHEVVAGTWSITVVYKGRVLASREYAVRAQ